MMEINLWLSLKPDFLIISHIIEILYWLCRFHHKQEVLRVLNQKSIAYKFLPPYSAHLNPIEELLGALKVNYKTIRPKPSSLDEIKSSFQALMVIEAVL